MPKGQICYEFLLKGIKAEMLWGSVIPSFRWATEGAVCPWCVKGQKNSILSLMVFFEEDIATVTDLVGQWMGSLEV